MGSDFQIEAGAPDAEGRCTVRVRVPDDLRYVEGHFEGDPIVPGVAQLIGLVWKPAKQVWPDLGPVRAIKRLKFLAALRPGHELVVSLRREPTRLRFEVSRDGAPCTRGSLVIGA